MSTEPEPGWSNSPGSEEDENALSVKVVKTDSVEDKAVKSSTSKRTARKKS